MVLSDNTTLYQLSYQSQAMETEASLLERCICRMQTIVRWEQSLTLDEEKINQNMWPLSLLKPVMRSRNFYSLNFLLIRYKESFKVPDMNFNK